MKGSLSLLACALSAVTMALPNPIANNGLSWELQRRVAEALTSSGQSLARDAPGLDRRDVTVTQEERRRVSNALAARGLATRAVDGGAEAERVPISAFGVIFIVAANSEDAVVALNPYEGDVAAADEAEVLGKRDMTPEMRREVAEALSARGQSLVRTASGLSARDTDDVDEAFIPIKAFGVIFIVAAKSTDKIASLNPYQDDVNAADEAEVLGKRDSDANSIIAITIIRVGVNNGENPYAADVAAADAGDVLGKRDSDAKSIIAITIIRVGVNGGENPYASDVAAADAADVLG